MRARFISYAKASMSAVTHRTAQRRHGVMSGPRREGGKHDDELEVGLNTWLKEGQFGIMPSSDKFAKFHLKMRVFEPWFFFKLAECDAYYVPW